MVDPAFWRPKEAAAYLKIHVNTLYLWLNPAKRSRKYEPLLRGPKPPFRRYGRSCIRFPVNEFKRWANSASFQKEEH